jgi:uncharacterized repeat protein (TIGR03803 family)
MSTVQHRGSTSRIFRRVVSGVQAWATTFVLTAVAIQSASAQTFTILYSFTGGADGGQPYAKLVHDSAGNLYGTTAVGGASNFGTVFKVDKAGNETVLCSFGGGADGANPWTGLTWSPAGNLYGTTEAGGASGVGTVFKINKAGKKTVLYNFTGTGSDGAYPFSRLIWDGVGNLYGTTYKGGASGNGTVFKLARSGKEKVLYSFKGGTDGENPYAGVVRDPAGNLYGTTFGAFGVGYGTVFRLNPANKEKVLHAFSGGSDGGYPYFGGLVRDSAGNLYGTTSFGGAHQYFGVVFKINKAGTQTVLYTFTGGADGGQPNASVIRDSAGNLYGTTVAGGAFGHGTIFKLDKTGNETVLYSFMGGTDAATSTARPSVEALRAKEPCSSSRPDQGCGQNHASLRRGRVNAVVWADAR